MSTSTPDRRRSRRSTGRSRRVLAVALSLATVSAAVVAVVAPWDPPDVEAAEVLDGSLPTSAAVSCWEIKKNDPSATSGLYWLVTPDMIEPLQYHCDMETDGGGWVLIGRGRDGWNFAENGQNHRSRVTADVDGPAAFDPAALSSAEIDGLLGGLTVDALSDGVRLRRAENTSGSSRQEIRWVLEEASGWRWGFDAASWIWVSTKGMPLASATAGGSEHKSGYLSTYDSRFKDGTRVWTYSSSSNGNVRGFNHDSDVHGSSSSTSYLYEQGNNGYATPFTQVFVRPRLVTGSADAAETLVSFPDVPAAGLPAEPAPAAARVVASKPVNTGWGVATEYDPNDQYSRLDTLVTSIEIIGDRLFVGGKFVDVRNGPNEPLISRPYLAAFDRVTGAWIPGFAPTLDGAVWDLEATPDGRLLVAGNFGSVNGESDSAGLVLMDPQTGAVDPGFSVRFTRNSGRVMVRSISIKDDWLYIGGLFNSVWGGTPEVANTGIGGLAKLRWSDGTVEDRWRPWVNKSVESLHASPTTDYLWLAGRFTTISGQPAHLLGAVSLTTGVRSEPPGMQTSLEESDGWPYHASGKEPVWSVAEYDGFVYHGGSQHYFGRHDTATYAQTGWAQNGNGDYQVSEELFGIIYGGCHCGTMNRTVSVDGSHDFGRIRAFGAWTPDNFDLMNRFVPDVRNWREAAWAMKADPLTGCLWVGGDFGGGPDGVYISGLAKMCVPETMDTSSPTPPGAFLATPGVSATSLSWVASTDDITTSPRYQVLRNGRPIGVTTTTSFEDPTTEPATYAVRAIDDFGNFSASTPAVDTEADSDIGVVIPLGSTWRYRAIPGAPPADWATTADVTSWASGPAPLGAGGVGEITTIPTTSVSQYFVNDITIDDPSRVGTLGLLLSVDDGAVVRVNGIEATRSNLAFGPIGVDQPAYQEITGPGGTGSGVHVPGSLLVPGTNRISVELHQVGPGDADAFVDLQAVTYAAASDPPPVLDGALTTSNVTDTAVTLDWPGSTDADVVGYVVSRDGLPIAYRWKGARNYRDQQLAPGSTHLYAVSALDSSGHLSAPLGVAVTTTGGVVPVEGVDSGAAWRVLDNGATPPVDWASTADVSGWGIGVGSFGAGPVAHDNELSTQAVTQYLTTDFTVADPDAWRQIVLDARVDDGAVLRLNGVEIARANLPFGVPGPETPSYNERTGDPERLLRRLPTELLAPGVNRLSIELHQVGPSDGDAFASALLTLEDDDGDSTPPGGTTLTATDVAATAVTLSWPAAVDDTQIAFYRVERDGATIVYRHGGATSYRDQQLARATTFTYELTPVDTNGNSGPTATVQVTTAP